MSQKKKKILLTRRWPAAVEQALQHLVGPEVALVTLNTSDKPLSEAQLIAALADYDIIGATVTDQLSAAVFAAQPKPRCQLIANFGVGVNHIDLAAATAQGIAVTNTPGVLTDATAELALTLLLMSARRAAEGERHVRARAWTGWRPTHMLSTQVTGKTLGIVGMGRIGLALARKAHHGLGMRIVYHNRTRVAESVELELGAHALALPQLLASADFVSLNCPATPTTRGLIDQQALALMPQHAHLINTARGDVVDEGALIQALQNGDIAGAGLDVFAEEPEVPEALLELSQVVLLPHMGSGTVETRDAMGFCAMDNMRDLLAGQPCRNLVHP